MHSLQFTVATSHIRAQRRPIPEGSDELVITEPEEPYHALSSLSTRLCVARRPERPLFPLDLLSLQDYLPQKHGNGWSILVLAAIGCGA